MRSTVLGISAYSGTRSSSEGATVHGSAAIASANRIANPQRSSAPAPALHQAERSYHLTGMPPELRVRVLETVKEHSKAGAAARAIINFGFTCKQFRDEVVKFLNQPSHIDLALSSTHRAVEKLIQTSIAAEIGNALKPGLLSLFGFSNDVRLVARKLNSLVEVCNPLAETPTAEKPHPERSNRYFIRGNFTDGVETYLSGNANMPMAMEMLLNADSVKYLHLMASGETVSRYNTEHVIFENERTHQMPLSHRDLKSHIHNHDGHTQSISLISDRIYRGMHQNVAGLKLHLDFEKLTASNLMTLLTALDGGLPDQIVVGLNVRGAEEMSEQTSEKACRHLANFLKKSETVKYLDLSSMKLKGSGLMRIFMAIAQNKSLEHVCISGNNLDARSSIAIANAMELSTSLRVMRMDGCNIDGECATRLSKALDANSSLEIYVGADVAKFTCLLTAEVIEGRVKTFFPAGVPFYDAAKTVASSVS